MKTLAEERKQHLIQEVNATMSMENMPLTPEDKDRLKRYLDDKITINEAIEEITRKYKR